MKNALKYIKDWFEHGDLIPLLVLVSAAHYMVILQEHDASLVAVAIGLLVDLGHYRVVRAAVRYNHSFKGSVVRWIIVLAMTAVAFSYHWRFYEGDILLAAPVPLLIAVLAWLAKVDANVGAKRQPAKAKPSGAEAKPEALAFVECRFCDWRKTGPSAAKLTNALNAHMRKHKEKR